VIDVIAPESVIGKLGTAQYSPPAAGDSRCLSPAGGRRCLPPRHHQRSQWHARRAATWPATAGPLLNGLTQPEVVGGSACSPSVLAHSTSLPMRDRRAEANPGPAKAGLAPPGGYRELSYWPGPGLARRCNLSGRGQSSWRLRRHARHRAGRQGRPTGGAGMGNTESMHVLAGSAGAIDPVVIAGLCAWAIGPGGDFGVHMPMPDSSPEPIRLGTPVSNAFDFESPRRGLFADPSHELLQTPGRRLTQGGGTSAECVAEATGLTTEQVQPVF
jgi:hypothetical protein